MSTESPKITAVSSWYGSNRMLAENVGHALKGCKWVGVPYAGGMSELKHIEASTLVVSDLHRHVINLALCIKNPASREQLIESLDKLPFHPDVLASAQARCQDVEAERDPLAAYNVDWAVDYFVCCWMGRSAKAGAVGEFSGGLPVRWNANGGDSNTRYRSAIESLDAWGEIMKRCNFCVMDAFDFLDRCKDEPGHGIYCDPPFPGPGDKYVHKMDEAGQRRLASKLASFKFTLIVCRFYDHPLVREIYPEGPQWRWRRFEGRKQSNDTAPEVLIVRNMQ